MNEIEDRLNRAIMQNLDPHSVSPRGSWFAWYPVRTTSGKWRWFRLVRWFRPLGLFNEYYDQQSSG